MKGSPAAEADGPFPAHVRVRRGARICGMALLGGGLRIHSFIHRALLEHLSRPLTETAGLRALHRRKLHSARTAGDYMHMS